MAKIKTSYICSECGFESPKWYGKCPSCGEWNTLNEELNSQQKQLFEFIQHCKSSFGT